MFSREKADLNLSRKEGSLDATASFALETSASTGSAASRASPISTSSTEALESFFATSSSIRAWIWELNSSILNFEFIYNTKKYGIPCERRFEINSDSVVIGFVSNGCF